MKIKGGWVLAFWKEATLELYTGHEHFVGQ